MNGSDEPKSLAEESRELLYRMDERQESILNKVNEIQERTHEQDAVLDSHDKRISRNELILNALTFGLSGLLTAGLAKVVGVFDKVI